MTPENLKPQIGLYPIGLESSTHYLSTIVDHLQSSGVTYAIKAPKSSIMAAILLFPENATVEEISHHLPEWLALNSHTIILYNRDQSLPFYQIWEWLNMGIDEVLNTNDKINFGEIIRARIQRWTVINRFLNADKIKNELIGSCVVWKKTLRQVIEIACFSSLPVLILGESGTGKELIARLVHDFDKRPDKHDLVLLDCTTIVPELSGSEFFGHEKGAFTNAVSTRDGAFALADRGTLFLDEIGELPLRLQAELLRVIQEGIYKRVGSNTWKRTKFRLISATNRSLLEEVEKGNFRQDLYYRIQTCVVKLPPLRERKLDIPELAAYFLKQELKTDSPPAFSPQVIHFLLSLDFPGNIRELKQLIARLAFRYSGQGPITLGHIPLVDRQTSTFSLNSWQEGDFQQAIRQALGDGIGLKDIKRIVGDLAMEIAIEEAKGNLQQAAQRLGVSDRLLQGFSSGKRS